MIYTGSYDNCTSGRLVSISGDGGKQANFNGETYKRLAPKLKFWHEWHYNIGKISDIENNNFYIREYYIQVLQYLNPQQVLQDLKDAIMLCYESSLDFCHRHIVAAWLELECGIVVPEISIDTYGNIMTLQKPNDIKENFKQLIYMK